MQNKKLVELYQKLNSVKDLKGVKFAYGIARNANIIKREIDLLQESIKPSEKFLLFENERIELAKKYSKKDDKGNPIIENNSFVMEDLEEFNNEFLELKDKYSEEIEEREKQGEEYNKLLEEENKIELFKINISDVPQDISAGQLEGIFDVIENGY